MLALDQTQHPGISNFKVSKNIGRAESSVLFFEKSNSSDGTGTNWMKKRQPKSETPVEALELCEEYSPRHK
jgi:hypothetical protein